MSRLQRLLALVSVPTGFVVSWTLYLNVVGSIGPVELLEVILLTIPIAITTSRLLRAGVAQLARRPAEVGDAPAASPVAEFAADLGARPVTQRRVA